MTSRRNEYNTLPSLRAGSPRYFGGGTISTPPETSLVGGKEMGEVCPVSAMRLESVYVVYPPNVPMGMPGTLKSAA